MPSPNFTRHPLACAVQAAIAVTALSLTLGAQAAPVDGSNNTVVINSGETVFKDVYGGFSQSGSANNNTVLINNDVTVSGNVSGGVSEGGNANGNTVTLKGGTYGSPADEVEIHGGQVLDGTGSANGNTVDISGIQGNAVIAGGLVDDGKPGQKGDANNNTVTVQNSKVTAVVGGHISPDNSGNATGNKVTIHGGEIAGLSDEGLAVAGGHVRGSGNADNNSVLIDGDATVSGHVSGHVSGGVSMKGNANGNTVTLKGGTYGSPADEVEIHGGQVLDGTGSANGNTVDISGIQGNAVIAGGLVDDGKPGQKGDANNNTVTVQNSKVTAVVGGHISPDNSGNATGNKVTIHGGEIAGLSDEGLAVAGGHVMGSGNANNNTVLIDGDAKILGNVYGGVSEGGNANNNTVTIEGNAADLRQAGLYGGFSAKGATGNTLNLNGVNGVQVREVANFQFLNFALPEDTKSGDTILTVTGTADIRGSTIGVRVQGSDPLLDVDDKVTLIDAGELKADSTIKTRGLQGSTIQYTFDTQQEGNTLTSTVTQRGSTESSKSLSEGFVAGAAALTATADFSASQGTAAAVGAVAGAGSNAPGQSFGSTGGGSVRNNTGSHVDVRSFNLVAGLAKGFKQADGELTVGGFFEYGHGNYSSYNNFATGEVRGNGKTRSYGVGVLGHYALNSGVYVEGSLRAGQAEQDYSSSDLLPGTTVSYDSKTNYVGSHIGVGKVWTLNESLDLDTYAHYVWQRQSGDTVKLSSGETLAFSAVTSQRVRLGARLTKGLTDTVSAYVGAGYENELDGKAKATTNGVPITSPSMKGDSGLVELGLITRPLKNKALTLGVGVQGYFGQKEGVTGTLQVGYKF